MKKIFKEFKEFISKGSVFNLAIGIIIGGAFRNIISSFVADILMPVISLILGNKNIAAMKVVLEKSSGDVPELSITYGMFIQSAIDFIFIAFTIFLLVKLLNKAKKKEEEASPPAPSKQELLLEEIRDLLKEK